MGRYGVSADVSAKEREHIRTAVEDAAFAAWGALGVNSFTSASQAFKAAYPSGLSFVHSSEKCTNCWGSTTANEITIYSNADVDNINFVNFLVHEMGHAFDNSVAGGLTNGYIERLNRVGWTPMPAGNDGYATSYFPSRWIQGDHNDGIIDETADMFLGWVYDTWGQDLRRANWMDLWMPYLLNGTTPPYDSQYRCDEVSGNGCY